MNTICLLYFLEKKILSPVREKKDGEWGRESERGGKREIEIDSRPTMHLCAATCALICKCAPHCISLIWWWNNSSPVSNKRHIWVHSGPFCGPFLPIARPRRSVPAHSVPVPRSRYRPRSVPVHCVPVPRWIMRSTLPSTARSCPLRGPDGPFLHFMD